MTETPSYFPRAAQVMGGRGTYGSLFFYLLRHMNLADDVAGIAPVPSPRIGQTWMETLGIFIYKAFCLQVDRNCYSTLLFPKITSHNL